MPEEPRNKRTIAFVDGQNLFHAAKNSFGYQHPNYDPQLLAQAICAEKGWDLIETRFYTGVPTIEEGPHWHAFWANKLRSMSRKGVVIYRRDLKYKPVRGTPGILVGDEKGIDVRIALDIVRKAFNNDLDVALLFSQDQDFSEVADEIRILSTRQDRWIKMASAYPRSAASRNKRGVNHTDWIPINAERYNECIDPWDYRNSDGNK